MYHRARMMSVSALALLFVTQLFAVSASAEVAPTIPTANPSLGGPVAETVTGGVLLLATPVVASIIVMALGPPWFGCDSTLFGPSEYEPDSACERDAQQQSGRAAAVAAAVGSVQGLGGAALLIHGAYRTRRIRVNRRKMLTPNTWQLQTTPRTAGFAVGWSF